MSSDALTRWERRTQPDAGADAAFRNLRADQLAVFQFQPSYSSEQVRQVD